ncbi:DUF4440 domain-containing protein [Devosia sp. RR2S18]|uniref:DUF4440 domain-containing protein n=1 Tax=Devosia rhizosphaerae TaxID=3049774 RepID=UPI00254048BA|nr:DUF4440 domain-containing protein [Devosia sp. RR2S18]WIJ23413.1 DUF4440 domain-containing protein [Devosia sp. RR2S18]
MNDEMAWKLEERLWLDGVSAYEEIVDPACLMAFPGIGVLGFAAILKGLKGAARWATVKMMDRTVSRAGKDVVVLGYTAEGQREGSLPYRCFCTSTYRAVGEDWLLVQHQQTLAN